jgi:hypothetical protein
MNNTTKFHRDIKTVNYTVISNSLIKSTEYTAEEKVILIYLLSLADTWKLYKEFLEKEFSGNMSKGRFDKAWSRLKKKGHIIQEKIKGETGTFSGYHYDIWETPKTEIPESDWSGKRSVRKPTNQISGDIISTNTLNTNIESTKEINLNNTSIILGENKIKNKNKHWNQKEIQKSINLEGMNKIFDNTGIDWINEITKIDFETFVSKYQYLSNDDDGYRLRFK